MKTDKQFFLNRYNRIMKDFVPSEQDIQKIIELNDSLYERFRLVYDDVVDIKRKIDSDIKNKKLDCSGYCIFPEYFFAEDYFKEVTDFDITEQFDKLKYFLPQIELTESSIVPDFETEFINHDSLNWNIEDLSLPGIENHYIYYFMHSLFVDSNIFCVADIPNLQAKDLKWQITVQLEKFNK